MSLNLCLGTETGESFDLQQVPRNVSEVICTPSYDTAQNMLERYFVWLDWVVIDQSEREAYASFVRKHKVEAQKWLDDHPTAYFFIM